MILKRGWQVLMVVLSMAGCAGELRDPGRFAFVNNDEDGGLNGDGGANDAASAPVLSPPPSCVTALFKKSCALTACHAANSTQIDLASAGVERRLVDKASTSTVCRNRVYISTSGDDSLLIDKLEETPPCGAKMPIGPALSTAETTCLTDWVESLAK